jgi:hypothetical protein
VILEIQYAYTLLRKCTTAVYRHIMARKNANGKSGLTRKIFQNIPIGDH